MENKPTPEELAIQAGKEYKAAIQKRIEDETKAGFLNPFGEGVNYEQFLKACGGKANVANYCKGMLDEDPTKDAEKLAFLLSDLKHYDKDFPAEKTEDSPKKNK